MRVRWGSSGRVSPRPRSGVSGPGFRGSGSFGLCGARRDLPAAMRRRQPPAAASVGALVLACVDSVINLLQINSAGGTSSRLPLTCRSSSARGSHLFGTHPSTHVPGCDRRSQHTPKGTRGPSETPRTTTRRPGPPPPPPPRRPAAPSFRKKCGPRPLMQPSSLTSPSHPIP